MAPEPASERGDALTQFANELSESRRGNQSLTTEARAAICASIASGQSVANVAKAFNITRGTVYNTVQRHKTTGSFVSRPRSGRPRALNEQDERNLIQLHRQNPGVSYEELARRHGSGVSKNTIKRILKNHGETKEPARPGPKKAPK